MKIKMLKLVFTVLFCIKNLFNFKNSNNVQNSVTFTILKANTAKTTRD